MKLRTLKSGLRTLNAPARNKGGSSEFRIAGRRLQNRRLKMWSENPHCAACGRLTDYPHGFELDHKTPLHLGGRDAEDNCQILCVWYDEHGSKMGCHAGKTAEESNGRSIGKVY